MKKLNFDKALWAARLKKAGIILLWVTMCSGLIMSLAFVNREQAELVCSKVLVHITPDNGLFFVDRDTVLRTIRPDGNEKKILGKKLSSFNTPDLERRLLRNSMVRHAEVYTDMNGTLHIHIAQREPLLRILKDDATGYYLDHDGLKMPLSQAFSARVPVATGNIYEPFADGDSASSFVLRELFKIATYVDKDAFWKAQIEQIFVSAESDLVLIPKLGNHKIIFGTTEGMEEKFGRLMLFYKEALNRVGWNTYSTINLKYKDQVVGVKRNKNDKYDGQ